MQILAKRRLYVDDLFNDLDDGTIVCNLVEILGKKPLWPKFIPAPKHRLHYIQNLSTAIKTVESYGVKLIAIGAEDLADRHQKLTLGFLWAIIAHFHVKEANKAKVLDWVRDKLDGEAEAKVVGKSLRAMEDGRVLAALLNKLEPETISPDDLLAGDPTELLKKVFEEAHDKFAIPMLLDAEDVIMGKVDDQSMMTCARLRPATYASHTHTRPKRIALHR